MRGNCWLCSQSKTLVQSHMIPAFAFKWQKDTAASPFLRKGENPNRRVQDGDKHPLYCNDCEQMLSRWENTASSKIFKPATRREPLEGGYGGWLSRFAASLAIRTVHSQLYRKIDRKTGAIDFKKVKQAAEVWRQFLIGETSNPGAHRLYFLYDGYFDHFDADDLPSNWNTYIHRSIERDLMYTESGNFCATFVKLGPLTFFGSIISETKDWKQDSIRCGDWTYSKHNFTPNKMIWQYYILRAKSSQKIMAGNSEKQQKIIDAETLRREAKFVRSDLFRSLKDDFDQFPNS